MLTKLLMSLTTFTKLEAREDSGSDLQCSGKEAGTKEVLA